MTRKAFLVLFGIFCGLIPHIADAAEAGADWTAELQTFLGQTAEALQVPGSAVVVVTREGGLTILTDGVLCLDANDPVTPSTSFGIASLTKAFTATAAAALVGDGAVDWDTKVRTVVPELELADPVATQLVTLRDLLCHRSGLGDHYLLMANIDDTPAWILPRLPLIEPAGDFRDRHIYSSLGYSLAGEVLARVSHSSWAGFVSQRLIEPLKMKSTTIGAPQNDEIQSACGHHLWRGTVTPVEALNLGVGAPGNGLYSSADDLALWLEMLLGEGEFNDKRAIAAEALKETWTPQVVMKRAGPEVLTYGLGWNVTSWHGRRLLTHGGGGVGFTSQARLYPETGVAVAVLANRSISGLPDVVAERACKLIFGEEIREDLLDIAVKMTARIETLHAAPTEALRSTADPESPSSLEISAYAGCYEHPAFGRLVVRAEGGSILANFHGFDLAVEHLHDDVFMLSSVYMGDIQATFSVKQNAVESISVSLGSPENERVFERDAGSCSGRPSTNDL